MADILEGEHEVNFTWFTSIELPDISSVEIILAPAKSVWDDHFDENNYAQHTVSYGLTQHNGVFSISIPLKTNIYHFLFRINCKNDFAASYEHNVTYLANGRMLNYVNVGDPLHGLLNKEHLKEENVPLRDPVTSEETSSLLTSQRRPKKRTGLRRLLLCCSMN